MDRRILIIRSVFLLLVYGVVALLWPSRAMLYLSFIPVGFFFCCCSYPCPSCSDNLIQVIMQGGNGPFGCCSAFNATFILSATPSNFTLPTCTAFHTCCIWGYYDPDSAFCCTADPGKRVLFVIDQTTGLYVLSAVDMGPTCQIIGEPMGASYGWSATNPACNNGSWHLSPSSTINCFTATDDALVSL